MSSTGRSNVRKPYDFYATPPSCVQQLLASPHAVNALRLRTERTLTWCDPCAGDGAIIRAVHPYRPRDSWCAIEIRDEVPDPLPFGVSTWEVRDALVPGGTPDCDIFMTNPPYSLALEFIEACLPHASIATVMLLRLNFLGSQKRATFFHDNPPDVYVLPNRPSFTSGGTDSTEYAWFLWPGIDLGLSGRQRGSVCVLPTLDEIEV